MSDWRQKLLAWYEVNKRELPWRGINDPYKIWLSEVILQQTRVAQGLEYYNRFAEKYPTAKKLAAASEHEVLKLWQGLGYYSRARNMHIAAKEIVTKYKGIFPKDYATVKALKGVGEYTAAAITSIAYGLPYPVVDGNVLRVYSRILGISDPIDSTEGKKKIWEAAAELLPKKNPGIYNQAVMELGALCCTPKNPNCNECPVQSACYAYAHKLTDKLPVKQGKTKQRDRHLNYIIIQHKGKIILRHRTGNGIWKGMYDFLCIETGKALAIQKLVKTGDWAKLFNDTKPVIKSVSESTLHILSHQKLYCEFIQVELSKPMKKLPDGCSWVVKKKVEEYALPRVIENYIRKYF